MAYLREILRLCSKCAYRKATHELLSNRNATHGYFCSKCAAKALRDLEMDETQPYRG